MPHLFSYGTLQDPKVQIEVFGREVAGKPDAIIGFRQDFIEITDPDVLATSKQTHHPIISRSCNPSDSVAGTVFTLNEADIVRADAYEVDDYVRTEVELKSGRTAWLYVQANP